MDVLRATAVLGFVVGLSACGGSSDQLLADFNDELVSAAGRSVSVVIVNAGECEPMSEISHLSLDGSVTVIERRSAPYPLDPEADLLKGIEEGLPIAVDVAVLDDSGQQIGRGCSEVVLSSAVDSVKVDLRTLPVCATEWRGLSVSLVLDRSLAARNANIPLEGAVFDELISFVESMQVPGGVTWNLVDHGPASPSEVVSGVDATTMVAALTNIKDTFDGESEHYAAITLATTLARARALCPERPVILWIGAGDDTSPDPSALLATVGLAGVQGDLSDDLYIFAIPLTETARTSILILLNNLERRDIEGAATRSRFREALNSARFRFQALVAP